MQTIVYEKDQYAILDVANEVPRHPNFPYGAKDVVRPWDQKSAVEGQYHAIPQRRVRRVYCHQTAGSVTKKGFDAVMQTALFMIRNPAWKKKNNLWVWTGEGRGWPGIAYTYYVPFEPDRHRGKYVLYRLWNHDWITWHSGDNLAAIGIAFQGYFRSKHIRSFIPNSGCDGHPNLVQMGAFHFLKEYLSRKHQLKTFLGHCQSPQPKMSCPGDDLYRLCQEGKTFSYLEGEAMSAVSERGSLCLDSWFERQAALVLLGHDLGTTGAKENGVDGIMGPRTRAAIELMELQLKLPKDGFWDDTFDRVFKLYLQSLGTTQADIEAQISAVPE